MESEERQSVRNGAGMIWKLWRRLIPIVRAGPAVVDHDAVDDKYKEVFSPQPGQTGWDRLRMMFTADDYGEDSEELRLIYQGLVMAVFGGACLGAMAGSREAANKFMETNEATLFHNQMDAKRRLQDKVFLGMMRSSFRWAWRLGLFTSTFLFTVTTVSVYRNKFSLWEYMLAGAVSGSTYKISLGPRAMAVGGLAGSMLGTIAGSVTMGLMWAAGTDMEELKYWRSQTRIQRQREAHERTLQRRIKSAAAYNPLLQEHDSKIKDKPMEFIQSSEAPLVSSTSVPSMDKAKENIKISVAAKATSSATSVPS